MVSSMLYEKRYQNFHISRNRFGPYFVEPVICGLEGKDNKPYIAAMDLIGTDFFSISFVGAPLLAKDFVLSGASSSEAMYGVCETLWKPDLVPTFEL